MKRRGAEIEDGRSRFTSGSFSKSAPERDKQGQGDGNPLSSLR
jgi:hypothetical protein